MKRKILVLDDERQIVLLVTRFLEGEGYEVVSAGDGKAGLLLAKEQAFDLILADVNMPGTNAAGFFHDLSRRGGGGPRVPLLIITGDPDIEKQLAGALIDGVIPKPFNFTALLEKVRQVFDARSAEVPAPESEGMKKALILDKGADEGRKVEDYLRREGFHTVRLKSANELQDSAVAVKPDIILIRAGESQSIGPEVVSAARLKNILGGSSMRVVIYGESRRPVNEPKLAEICHTAGIDRIFFYDREESFQPLLHAFLLSIG